MTTLVIVTGGSAGIGRSVLAAAPEESHRVSISRSAPGLPGVDHLAADLADPGGWSAVGDHVEDLVGRREWTRIVVVQAAGTLAPIGFVGEVDDDAMRDNVLLNVAAPQVLGHRFLAAVGHLDVARDLLLLSSGAARTDYPGWAAYGAAKAAIDRWVSTVGEEQSTRGGVRVLSVAPGVVATGMQAVIRSTDEHDFPRVERFRRLHAEGRLADPDEVAGALWGVLDDPAVTTGAVIDLRDR